MSAKEMFKELGYKETENDIYFLKYSKKCRLHHDKEIKFCRLDRTFCIKDDYGTLYRYVTLDELQAINQQLFELGWLNE